ncbi:hypothetical protein Emag_004645 [Eimeria magna]
MEQSATSCDGSIPVETEDEVKSWISSSNCRSPWQNCIFDIPLPPPPRLEPHTSKFLAEQRTLQQHSHAGVSARRRPRQALKPCWQPKGGLDASTQPIDNNEEQFEMMLESLVKVLVAKAIEQSTEEINQEQQLQSLLQRKQELLQQQEKGLRELEGRETLRQEKFFLSATDEAACAALTEFAKCASIELKARVVKKASQTVGRLSNLINFWTFAQVLAALSTGWNLVVAGAHSLLNTGFNQSPRNDETFKGSNNSKDSAEMLQKAQAAVTAAVDVFSLSLPETAAQEDLRNREGVLETETQRIIDAFEEEHQQLARLQEMAGFGIKKWTLSEEMPKREDLSTSTFKSAALCLGSFKILRPGKEISSNKELISMEQLLLEVQHRLCKCFSVFADAIRNTQITIEVKGKKISKMNALLDHEFGDLRIRFERKIKFADQTDNSGDEADADFGNERDA